MITLSNVLVLAALLFCISVAGIFLNRKNILIILMCIELMLLSVNMNFIAFSHFMGDINGQVFVFFHINCGCCRVCDRFSNSCRPVS